MRCIPVGIVLSGSKWVLQYCVSCRVDTNARADLPEQTERRKAQIDLARAGKLGDVVEALWPLFVHKDRHEDAALKKVIVQMAQDTGADAFIRQQMAIMSRPDSRPDLPKIKCPTLVLVGEGDQLTPPNLARRDCGRQFRTAVSSSFPAAGISRHSSAPTAVNKALTEWMS